MLVKMELKEASNISVPMVHITETSAYKHRQKQLEVAKLSVLEEGQSIKIVNSSINRKLEYVIGISGVIVQKLNGKLSDGSVNYLVLLDDKIFATVNSNELEINE